MPLAFLGLWIALGLGAAPPARATTLIAPDFSTLVGTAQRVVHGSVLSVKSAWVEQSGYRVIKTWVTIRVVEDLTEPPTGDTSLVLEFLGGRVGDAEMKLEGSPRFSTDDELVLFVSKNGIDACPLVGWGHGAYRVASDTASGNPRILRSNGLALARTADVALPLEGPAANHPAVLASAPLQSALTLSAFKQAIRAEQARK